MELWQQKASSAHHSLAHLADQTIAPKELIAKIDTYLRAVDTPYAVSNKKAQYNNICNVRTPQAYKGNIFESVFDLQIFLTEIKSTVDYNCEDYANQVGGNYDRIYNGITTQIKFRNLERNKLRIMRADFANDVELVVYFTYLDDTLVMIANAGVVWKDMLNFRTTTNEFADRELRDVLNMGGKIITVHPAIAECVLPIRDVVFPFIKD